MRAATFTLRCSPATRSIVRPRRKDEPDKGPHLAPIRQRIESIFWTFKDLLTLERHGARSLHGLRARISQRLLALAAGIALKPPPRTPAAAHSSPPAPDPWNDKAVYAYAREDTDWWADVIGRDFGSGAFGENLTTEGVSLSDSRLGDRWRVGTTLLEVRQTRLPCFKLGIAMRDPRFVKAFARADRPGAYLRILEEGDVGAGDPIEVVHRPDHDVTVALMSHAFLVERTRLGELLAAPELMPDWRAWIESREAG